MTYPGGRVVTFGYSADAASNMLGRVTDISSNGTAHALYSYIGLGRRVGTLLGNGVSQSFGQNAVYAGLDQFGRPRDLDFKFSGSSLHRYQYGYDPLGNRTFARVDQAIVNGIAHLNKRSFRYQYDGLQRLVGAQMGELNQENTAIVSSSTVPLYRSLLWGLDTLGNWTGYGDQPGLERDDVAYGAPVGNHDIWHAVDTANQLATVTTDSNPAVQHIYDAAGNLVFDGVLYYQYDGFNRLVRVDLGREPEANGTVYLTAASFLTSPPADRGKLAPTAMPGPMVAAFTYDGLGRLIRTARQDRFGTYHLEGYYYDGVRRVREDDLSRSRVRLYVWGPGYVDEVICQYRYLPSGGGGTYGMSGSDGGVEGDPGVDGGLDGVGGLAGGGTDGGGGGTPQAGWYGPVYYLQDANYNVVALVRPDITTVDTAVWMQHAYEPYGATAAADVSTAAPADLVNRIGHQGLFFERFCIWPDEHVTDVFLQPDDPSTGRRTAGLYYNRNRWYSPELGRFIERDPRDTALGVPVEPWFLGVSAPVGALPAIELTQYEFGMNLHEYLGSNTTLRLDPMGLGWTLFDLGMTLGGSAGIWSRMADYPLLKRGPSNGILATFIGWVGKNAATTAVTANPGAQVTLNHPVALVMGLSMGYYMGNLLVEAVATLNDMGFDDVAGAADWWLGF